jgi:NAD(P)-dependent dehydrogenase (short-subunit alcohol dehydrogenase family)
VTGQLRFDGRVAVVTGAGNGLGKAHALLLASRGASVVVNDLGGDIHGTGASGAASGAAQSVVDEIVAEGGTAVASTASVASVEGGESIVQTALDAFGRIDILINNAGIIRDRVFHKMEPGMIDAVLDVHLRGTFNVTRPAWIRMREAGYGRILNTTSISGILGMYGQANYGAAKMGVIGLTRVLCHEGERFGIKVNALAPVAKTRMTDELMSADWMQKALDPSRVAPVVAFLVHEDCPVTGEIYSAGGGRVNRFFIGLSPGYFTLDPTVEDVADNFDRIRDEAGYTVQHDPSDEFAALQRLLGQIEGETDQ